MGPDLALQGALLCLLAVLAVQPVSSEDCVLSGTTGTVYQKTGKFGNTLTLNAEVNDYTYLRQWSRTVVGNNGATKDILIVTYNGTQLLWRDESYENDFTAFYTPGVGSSKTSFKLDFKRLTCQDRGVFFCSFLAESGTCKTSFNVNITADPLPPVIKNQTVVAAAGSQVTVLCEANIGYPAGDIAWYYVPNDGGIVRKLSTQQDEITDAGDCRMYSKSNLMYTVKREDHLAKFRCSSRDYFQKVKDSAEVEIQIEGLIIPTTTPANPCIGNCTDEVKDGGGGASQMSLSVLVVLSCTLLVAFASSILHTES